MTVVDVSHKKIVGCLACEYCHGKGNSACIQKDDMQDLYPLLMEAEALVTANADEQKTDVTHEKILELVKNL